MPKQPAFPVLRDAMKKKQTRREVFLSEMEAVVPWGGIVNLSALAEKEPHTPGQAAFNSHVMSSQML
jgi:hypothetical protein